MTQPTFTAFTSPYNYNHVPLAIPSISTFHALNLQMYQHQIQLANLNRAMQYQQFVVQQKNLENLFLSQQKQLQDYSRVQNIKEAALLHPLVDLHNDQIEDSRNLKVEEIIEVCSNTTSSSDIQQITSHDDQREVINDLLCYFLSHFGKTDPKDLHKQKMKYAHDPVLTQLFDVLIMKYKTGSKSREDMVRFVMRKSITWLRDQTRNKSSMSAKSASVALCQRYFEEESANKSDDELLSLLLPYKKNSRYPVVNSQFMKEIFGSKKFCQDYMGYLEKYVEIMEDENKKKIKQFTEFLLSCVRNNSLEKVLTYKRVPWLESWVDASQKIACELYELHGSTGKTDLVLEQQDKRRRTK